MASTEAPQGTDSYSEGQKLALYYKELQDNNLSWRPVCPKCRASGRGNEQMIKDQSGGFYCLLCKHTVNRFMQKG